MVVALSFDIRVSHQEYCKDDDHDVPTWEDETSIGVVVIHHLVKQKGKRNLRERVGDLSHLRRSIPGGKGDHGRDLEKTYLKRIRRTDFHAMIGGETSADEDIALNSANLNAMFPFKANEIAFMNSVVLGTKAKRVMPRNFSSMPEPSNTTSTTSTRSSGNFH